MSVGTVGLPGHDPLTAWGWTALEISAEVYLLFFIALMRLNRKCLAMTAQRM